MSGSVDVTENMEVNIINEIENRLSVNGNSCGYYSLRNKAKERIQKFLKWIASQPDNVSTEIELRPRTWELDGTKTKSNFTADHLYEELFHNIKKTRASNNDGFEVSCPLKFDITLNKNLANKELKQGANGELEDCKNEDDEIFYAIVTLGKMPVLYLLYIDPTKDFDFVD